MFFADNELNVSANDFLALGSKITREHLTLHKAYQVKDQLFFSYQINRIKTNYKCIYIKKTIVP